MDKKYVVICLLCALWTILQTGFHLVFLIYSYYLSVCLKTPTDIHGIFFYLTYLYNSDCTTPTFQNSTVKSSSLEHHIFEIMTPILGGTNENNFNSLEKLVATLLKHLDLFPNTAPLSSRTSVFLLCFIILDGTWIISAVSLAMGICFGIKETLSLVFYGPWLIMTICVCIFDAIASVFFGFDITNTMTFPDWLNFVGITANSSFLDFDPSTIPLEVTAAPSITLCAVSSRFVLIWLSNFLGFIFVMKATISVFHESYKNEIPSRPRTLIESPLRQNRIDLDDSAARIRNWQLFYGAVDANSSKSESEKDLNSNRRESRESSIGSQNATCYYLQYTDVAESVLAGEGAGCLEELRGQLPWSYTQSADKKVKDEKSGVESRVGKTKILSIDESGTKI